MAGLQPVRRQQPVRRRSRDNPGRAYKVSYNRPFTTRGTSEEDWLFNSEYPMVRWLERNGYDVSYFTGVDSDRLGAEIREHKAFLSVGHDEYWSGAQRANVEAARDAGVHLAFFSGNEVVLEDALGGRPPHARLLQGDAREREDRSGARRLDGHLARPASLQPGGRQARERADGNASSASTPARLRFRCPPRKAGCGYGETPACRPSGTATLTDGTVGYEWDEDIDNGARPPGLVRLSSTMATGVEMLLDYGSTYGPGTATHRLTMYRDTNGAGPDALVFGAGTVQWSWGLDDEHDRGNAPSSPAMQQATVNLFADMLVQPATLQSGLTRAAASTDTAAPTSAPSTPTRLVTAGTPVTVSGTAADTGGGRVGGVEVSVDGGATWHPASGRESWSYSWTPAVSGQVNVRSRAVDDSGNLEGAVTGGGGGQPGGGGTPPQGGTTPPSGLPNDVTAPRVRVWPRRVRASRRGSVALRVRCPRSELLCRVDLALRRDGARAARKKFTMAGGKTRRISLRLNRSALRRLVRSRALRVVAVAAVRDAAGNRSTTRIRIRLLAPRRG